MNQIKKQHALKFLNWITSQGWYEATDGEWDNCKDPNSAIRLTPDELYGQFEKDTHKDEEATQPIYTSTPYDEGVKWILDLSQMNYEDAKSISFPDGHEERFTVIYPNPEKQ